MTIVLASSNQGKIKEFKKLLPTFKVKTFKEIVGDIEIIEDKDSFKGNAIKKAQTIYDAILLKYSKDINNFLVIADDSGISVNALNNEPNIYSARYAGLNATDQQNNEKLISKLKEKNIKKTNAHYTACIAIVFKNEIYTTHGWMYGDVIPQLIGTNGFGYDPLFIPLGFTKTLGELDDISKKKISHRAKALNLALKIIKVLIP